MSFLESISNMIDEQITGIHTGFSAKVLSFDQATRTATLEPLVMGSRYGSVTDYPILEEVPCNIQSFAGFKVKPSYKVGDEVYCVCSEADLGEQLRGRKTNIYKDTHQLNSAIIIGLSPSENTTVPPKFNEAEGFLISNDDGSASFSLTNSEIRLEVAGTVLTIDSMGLSLSQGDVVVAQGDVVVSMINFLSHTHTSSPPGNPSGPPMNPPGGNP